VLSIIAIPFMVLLALALTISFRAWPIFCHVRIGWNAKPFTLVKLRTLPVSVPKYADKYAVAGAHLPWFARLARSHHLDELPQLFYVAMGRMSLVGPRPEMAALHAELPESFAAARTAVRPGCTGLWQISTAAAGLIGENSRYDEYYLAHAGLALDLWILTKTALVMVGLSSPIRLSDVPRWATHSLVGGDPRCRVRLDDCCRDHMLETVVPR